MAQLPYTGTREAYPSTAFNPIPRGIYQAVVTSSELCENSKQTGWLCKLTWQIVEGQYTNRLIFSQHNVQHNNTEAERIGRRELQDFADVMGIGVLNDSDQLLGNPINVKVDIETGNGKYQDKNIIAGVALNAESLGKPQPGTPQPGTPQASTRQEVRGISAQQMGGHSPNGQIPSAHVVAAGTFPATGARKPAAGNTRQSPFVE